jgi:outer membrane immunogenic protein
MKYIATSALVALSLLGATAASAQEYRFPAVRADVQVGADRFYSEGNHNTKLGVGASVGADFLVGSNFVLGAEGTYWWGRKNENVTRDGPGIAYRRSFEEWGGAIRAGVLISPATLVYAKGGIVVNEQRKRFDRDAVATPGIPVNTAFGDYYNHYRTRGWTVGGGVEQLLSDNLYVKAEGRYSNYRTDSSRLVGLIGVGLRFGPSAAAPVEVAAPPPPPPPPAPATQTCPDGSVILATDACPAPPPPPPPPAPAPERG